MARGEFEFIESLARRFKTRPPADFGGPGDDCARVGHRLITTDLLVENIHFVHHFTPLHLLGRKSLAVNLSDIAASGGKATEFYLALARPLTFTDDALDQMMDGMAELANEFSVPLVGGDTTSSKSGLVICITVVGEVGANYIDRAGAQPGDLIAVTGNLGDSAMGLAALMTEFDFAQVSEQYPVLAEAHCNPAPQMAAGLALSDVPVSAMIDISDGLVADLGHILEQSGVGAKIELEQLPLSYEYESAAEKYAASFYENALSGGEDYQLLFTFSPDSGKKVEKALQEINVKPTIIGKIIEGKPPVCILDGSGKPIVLGKGGWNHFK
jgi:thiamine-monophosphate kinase